jgi:arylsulfatase A-like enzyme
VKLAKLVKFLWRWRNGRARGPLLALLALALGCGPSPPPNVVLIVADTLRWDSLGCYGHARNTTPFVDALAAEAVSFERAYATAPWTKPSVASMLTGLYPSAHGSQGPGPPLPASAETLAEILRQRGYATAGVISNEILEARKGFGQGFEVYDDAEAHGHDHVSTDGVTARGIALLGELATDPRPFLLFLHYFDPHFNYKRHPEFGFAAESAGQLDGSETIHELRAMLDELTEEEVGFLRDLHHEEIRFTDAGIGRLLAALRELDLDRNTLIAFTADHGEEFLEHGWLGHMRSLYEELVRVPLIIRAPAGAGRPGTVPTPVSLVSLTPTILDLVGVEPSPFSFQGPSLAPQVLGAQGSPGDPGLVFAEVAFRGFTPRTSTFKHAVLGQRFKLIRDARSGEVEIYDLRADPGERRNLASERADLARRLLPMLKRQLRLARERPAEEEVPQLSERDIEVLRKLGYL